MSAYTVVRTPTEDQTHNCYDKLPHRLSGEFSNLPGKTVVECCCGKQYVKRYRTYKLGASRWEWNSKWFRVHTARQR